VAAVVAQLVYGTCLTLGTRAALLRGSSGSGKSDLALRFILEAPPTIDAALEADDQVLVAREGDKLFARPPATIAGLIEVRGIGIVPLPYREAELRLLIDLVDSADIPRLPVVGEERGELCGISLPVLRLAPFEASAPLKLRLALQALA
jgi:serine kinase of HPr protein (carbohydrate metabolism regulator)